MPQHPKAGKHATGLAPDWDDAERLHKRLSNALIRIRDVYGLTSKEMAERLDVTESYMSQVFNGRRDVRLSMLNRISKAFNIEAFELLEDKWGEAKLRRRRRKTTRPRTAATE
jgi:transcriptional regulator with XRE-family HTH domain